MLHRPGASPRARNRSAAQAGAPGALKSSGCDRDGRLAILQRIRAPLKLAVPPSRTSQQGTAERSAATASRRVAVKSSGAGSPHSSPMTAPMPQHLRPSSIAHSASRPSRASTWMMPSPARPAGCTRPASRIAMRSWIQSTGLPAPSWGRRKPAQPPSRGETAKISERVGWGGAGRRNGSPGPVGLDPLSAARIPPPATRESSAATRLATHMFFFCSYSRESGSRVNGATRSYALRTRAGAAGVASPTACSSGGLPSISVRKARTSATTRLSAGR